jgi:hypothetical protein
MKMDCDKDLLKKSGLNFKMLDSGCCGMAGYFGYEKGAHYDVSIKCGERVLLPAVRNVSEETVIIADGFSCREQIEQQTDRKALHFAQVIQMGLREKNGQAPTLPERKYVDGMKLKNSYTLRNTVLCTAAFGIGLLSALVIKNK